MNYNNVDLQPCYVLHQKAYRDTSALVDVLSRQYGRVSLVAKGIKSSKSKMRGVLQPFFPLLISWCGKGDLQTLKTAEAHGLALTLPQRWVMSGFYLNELLMRLTIRHDPHANLYDRYDCTLKLLCQLANSEQNKATQNEHQKVLRLFEKYLLSELGYGLLLDHDAESGKPVEKEGNYQYHLEKGPVLIKNDWVNGNGLAHGLTKSTNASGLTVKGASLLSLAQDELDDTVSLQETKQLMRAVLSRYLGSKPLYSRDMFKQTFKQTLQSQPYRGAVDDRPQGNVTRR